ncbi:hypothetical protein H0H92_000688, partial [Tricholoma furcatifolium]
MPGRNSWVKGTKLQFYESRKEEFLRATASGAVASGRFYEKMARLTLLRWGWALPLDQDGPLLDQPTDEAAMQWSMFDDDNDGETKRKQFDALKKRLGNWFRHRYQYVNSNKQANGIVKDIISAMVETASIGSKNEKMTAMKL